MEPAERQTVIETLRSYRMFMIFHTHWDREWYSDANVYQHRAMEFMERVFEVHRPGGGYPAFYLDGQTCLLDDYLTICPGRRQQVRDMIAAGQLQTGPWYVMPEEHQPSGESHIRNLETGLRVAEELGDKSEKVGYLCDPITYIPQMPQILRKFGIASMLHGRGVTRDMGRSPQEMLAVAPDGSEVFLIHLNNSYYMDLGVTYEQFLDVVLSWAQGCLIPGSTSGNILLPSGGDQLYPTGTELGFIARMEKDTGIKITPTTLPEYARLLRETAKPAARVDREGPWSQLQDIFSARIPLKRRIKTCERKLERAAEPLAALAALCGADPQVELMRELWRRSTLNMFHDSIYCVHADEVARDIAHRCEMLEELLDRVTSIACYELARLAPAWTAPARAMAEPHALWNATGVAIGGFREVEIYCDTPAPRTFADSAGRNVPAMLLCRRTDISMLTERYTVDSQVNNAPVKTWQKYLLLLPPIPPTSPMILSTCPAPAQADPAAARIGEWRGPRFALGVRGNSLTLSWDGQEHDIRFRLRADAGSQYMFMPTGEEDELQLSDASWRQQGGITELSFVLRSNIRRLSVQGRAWMHPESQELRFRFEIDNDDRDFRLDLEMKGVLPGSTHTAHTPYLAVDRHDDPANDLHWAKPGFKVHFPLVEFFGLNGDDTGLNFFTPDITNYRVTQEGDLWIALLRSASGLTWGGPPLPTPDGYERGRSTFDLTLIPRKMTPVEQARFAWAHNSPPAYFPLNLKERSGVVRPERPHSPQAASLTLPFLQTDTDDVLVAAFRCIPFGGGHAWVARVVNLCLQERSCRLKAGFDFQAAFRTDLRHNAQESLAGAGREVPMRMAPGEIATVLFRV